jgi:putative tricarboxylic transport membrane protein
VRDLHRPGPKWLGALMATALVVSACTAGDDGGSPGASADGTTDYPTADIQLMAPADPGGGWDGTARAMQPVLQDEVVDVNVEVYNVPGAGGTIGLAQLVENNAGDPHQLMVMGLVMVGGIRTNNSATTLEDVTPIASLTSEQEAIAVSAESEFESLDQLIEAWKADPASIPWAGGSAGGTDHILVGLLAQAAEIDPAAINYVPYSGGGEALNDILANPELVGVSGVSEFADSVEAGQLRWLAVSGDAAPEGIDAPTISESGFDVVLENWRGVVAPPDITDQERDAIVQTITEMHDSDGWQAALEENSWGDFFMTGDEFATFVGDETTRVEGVLREIGLIE